MPDRAALDRAENIIRVALERRADDFEFMSKGAIAAEIVAALELGRCFQEHLAEPKTAASHS